MRRERWIFLGGLAVLAAVGPGPLSRLRRGEARGVAGLPVFFHPAAGGKVYVGRSARAALRCEPGGVRLKLLGDRRGVVVALGFAGGREAAPVGEEPLRARVHVFRGRRRTADLPLYRRVRYREVWPGVDLVLRPEGGTLAYDLWLRPGGDPAAATFRVEGAEAVRLGPQGSLLVVTAAGILRHRPPRAFVLKRGERRPLGAAFVRRGPRSFGFRVAGWDGRHRLLIDPGLDWSSFLGGRGDDLALAAAAVGDDVVVVGETASGDFPVTAGAFDPTLTGPTDAFVARFGRYGKALRFVTYLGGRGRDRAVAVATDARGRPTVLGYTESSDFPVTPGAWDRTYNGGGDAFVVRLDPAGRRLLFATYLGGRALDLPYAVALHPRGDVLAAGETRSVDFPVGAKAYDPTWNGLDDVFVVRLAGDATTLLGGTFLGSPGAEAAYGVAFDAFGRITVAGEVFGVQGRSAFPTTTNVPQRRFGGGVSDGFVARFDGALGRLLFSTFLGGGGRDQVRALALDPTGEVVVAGYTDSPNFPTVPGSFDPSYNGGGDAFVARLDAQGVLLKYATYLGGKGLDAAAAVALDPFGAATAVGATRSADFPLPAGAWQPALRGPGDVFAVRLDETGARVEYGTFLGGTAGEVARGVVLDSTNAATVVGETNSPDFPTTRYAVFRRPAGGPRDAFVTRLDMLPRGVRKFGLTTPSCRGPVVMGVTKMPVDGDPTFEFTCFNAPPGSDGVLLIGLGADSRGLPFFGAWLHVDPTFPFLPVRVYADPRGRNRIRIPVPAGARGRRVYVQYLWHNTPACMWKPYIGICASQALAITVQ